MKTTHPNIPTILLLLLLTGCATLPPASKMTMAEVAENCTVTREPFLKITYIDAPTVSYFDDEYTFTDYNLRAVQSDEGRILFVLSFATRRTFRSGWAFWNRIIDIDGRGFPVENSKREALKGGTVYESFQVFFERAYLEDLTAPQAFRIYGERATDTFHITPTYAHGFLKRVDQGFAVPVSTE